MAKVKPKKKTAKARAPAKAAAKAKASTRASGKPPLVMDQVEMFVEQGRAAQVAVDDVIAGKETKAEKFKRIASARVARAQEAMRQVGNLGSRLYEYDEVQIDLIVATLSAAVDDVSTRLRNPGGAFSLDEK